MLETFFPSGVRDSVFYRSGGMLNDNYVYSDGLADRIGKKSRDGVRISLSKLVKLPVRLKVTKSSQLELPYLRLAVRIKFLTSNIH